MTNLAPAPFLLADDRSVSSGFPLLSLSLDEYQRHGFHATDRVWAETNCYVDLWIEVLHSLGCKPVAGLGFAAGIDFEGDQWTFFKYPLEDLRALYGIDVAEYMIWRNMEEHLAEQARLGRFLIIEIDSWFLPDTAGVSYQKAHAKTSIVINELDPVNKVLRYFHGPGYFEASGSDYDGLLRVGNPTRWSGDVLPPYVEAIRLDRCVRRTDDELRAIARPILAAHLERRTDTIATASQNGQSKHGNGTLGNGTLSIGGQSNDKHSNAMHAFLSRFDVDISGMVSGDLAHFHAYAFATLRQLGAAAELGSDHLRWLGGLDHAANGFATIASAAKAMQFKLARLAAGRTTDLSATKDELLNGWNASISWLLEHGV
jgi:Domain of unknown function (DUF1839)